MHHGVNCRNGTCESHAVDGCDLTTTGGKVTTPGLQGVRQTQHQARKVAVTPLITSLTQGEFLPADYSHPPTIPIRTEMELTCDITTSGGLTVNADLHADLGLEGKVAIVAGGGAAGDGIGNGRAAAILLARAGARVLVVDRSLDLAEGTVRMIAAEGGEAAAHEADLTDEGQCAEMVEATLARFGRVDVLDNNVGIASRPYGGRRDPEPVGAGDAGQRRGDVPHREARNPRDDRER